jgi:acyl-CoA synthetase (AMP-forming)/AMP-acid ligase II
MLALGAFRTPRRPLFSMLDGPTRTYAEVDRRANRIANALAANGLVPGDRIAVWADDCVEYLETYLAAARGGFVMVPVNSRFTGKEAHYLVDNSEARCLLVSDRLAPVADETFAADDFALVGSFGHERPLKAIGFEDLVRGASEQTPPAPDEDAPFIIAYTSGTTGFPKGAVLSHRGVKNLARMNTVSYHLPLYGVAAYTGSMSFTATVTCFAMTHLYVGGGVILMGKWNPERALDTVIDQHATFIYVPTPGIADFSEALRSRPAALDSLVTVLHSGSKATQEQIRTLADSVGPRLVEGWGMTEISGGIVTATTASDVTGPCRAMDITASAGRATVDGAVRIVDEERRPLPNDGGTEGELVVRSASMMTGYWRRPEETAKVLQDGWYYSGDLGRIDPEGYVYVSERRSDLIVSGGMNVYPSEVESVIGSMPEVAEVAVVGVPHPKYHQTVGAAIVLKPGRTVSSDDIIEYCRANIASYKKPTVIQFVDELPKTVSQKLQRSVVRQQIFHVPDSGTPPHRGGAVSTSDPDTQEVT